MEDPEGVPIRIMTVFGEVCQYHNCVEKSGRYLSNFIHGLQFSLFTGLETPIFEETFRTIYSTKSNKTLTNELKLEYCQKMIEHICSLAAQMIRWLEILLLEVSAYHMLGPPDTIIADPLNPGLSSSDLRGVMEKFLMRRKTARTMIFAFMLTFQQILCNLADSPLEVFGPCPNYVARGCESWVLSFKMHVALGRAVHTSRKASTRRKPGADAPHDEKSLRACLQQFKKSVLELAFESQGATIKELIYVVLSYDGILKPVDKTREREWGVGWHAEQMEWMKQMAKEREEVVEQSEESETEETKETEETAAEDETDAEREQRELDEKQKLDREEKKKRADNLKRRMAREISTEGFCIENASPEVVQMFTNLATAALVQREIIPPS